MTETKITASINDITTTIARFAIEDFEASVEKWGGAIIEQRAQKNGDIYYRVNFQDAKTANEFLVSWGLN